MGVEQWMMRTNGGGVPCDSFLLAFLFAEAKPSTNPKPYALSPFGCQGKNLGKTAQDESRLTLRVLRFRVFRL